MKIILFTLCSLVFASSSSLSPDDLAILNPAKASGALLLSDSACGSCTKLIKELPSLCNLKAKSFSVLAVGNKKKNKKKLLNFEKDFEIFYSAKRSLLQSLKTPATPSLLINQKDFIVGYKAIKKHFNENKDQFCIAKDQKI